MQLECRVKVAARCMVTVRIMLQSGLRYGQGYAYLALREEALFPNNLLCNWHEQISQENHIPEIHTMREPTSYSCNVADIG